MKSIAERFKKENLFDAKEIEKAKLGKKIKSLWIDESELTRFLIVGRI